MTIYCVIAGNKWEHGELVSVHSTLEGATKSALGCIPESGGEWRPYEHRDYFWVSDHEYVEVVERKLMD